MKIEDKATYIQSRGYSRKKSHDSIDGEKIGYFKGIREIIRSSNHQDLENSQLIGRYGQWWEMESTEKHHLEKYQK